MMALRRHGGPALSLAILCPLLGGALLLAQAWLLAGLLQAAIVEGAEPGSLLPRLGGIAGLLALRALLGAVAEGAGALAAERIKRVLRRGLFGHVLRQRPDWTASRSSGALAAMVVEQVEALDGFFARFLPAMIQAALLPLAFAAVVMPVDWVVGLLFLFTAPLVPLFMALVGWGAEAASRRQTQAFARLSGYFADRLRGIVTLRLFGRAEAETEAVRAAADDLRRRTLVVLRIAFLSSAVLEFFAALGVAGVALYVGLTYLDLVSLRGSALTLQAGLFCLLMAPEVYQPLRLLAVHYHDRASARAAVTEIARALDGLPEIAAPAPAAPIPALPRLPASAFALSADALTLRTPDGSRTVLEAASLRLPAGESIAVLGESGVGKSTLLEALAGLRDGAGEILLAGHPLSSFSEAELREHVAILGQRPRIFQGTIAENIRLGWPDASEAALLEAAELAQVMAFARNLPLGLETPVGEGGLGLSGGEAHRVALARIFLRDPALVLLDEPTAHLDAGTEARVLDGIQAFARGRGLIVVTHSSAVAARMDRVWHLSDRGLSPLPPSIRHPALPAAREYAA